METLARDEDILRAAGLQREFQISWWDALILNSAIELGCSTLWTEDLNHGQRYSTLTVRNPFACEVLRKILLDSLRQAHEFGCGYIVGRGGERILVTTFPSPERKASPVGECRSGSISFCMV